MKTNKNNILFTYFLRVLSALVVIIFLYSPAHAQTQKTWKWAKQLGGPSWNTCSGVAIDSKDNLYVAGSFSTTLSADGKKVKTIGGSDIFLARFTTGGRLTDLWNYGGKGFDEAGCITTGVKNTIILGGTLSDTATFGKQTIRGKGPRLFVSTTDAKGRVSWVTTLDIGGNASITQLATDAQGTIYAAGIFTGNLTGNDKKVISQGLNDVFLLRMNSAGAIEQLISFGSKDEETLSSLSADKEGNVTLSGSFIKAFTIGDSIVTPGKGKTSLFMAHFSKTLTLQWTKVFSAEEYASITSLCNDAQDNLYVAGNFTMKLTTPDTTLNAAGLTDAFLLKYNPAGEKVWSRQIGSHYYDYATGLHTDNIGGIILTGSIGDTLQIDSVSINLRTRGDAAFVAQFTGEGKAIWGDYISGSGRNFSSGSVLDKDGNIYLCGSFKETFIRDDGGMKAQGNQDIFLARYYNCPDMKLDFTGDPVFCPGTITGLGVRNNYKTIVWNDTLKDVTYLDVKKPGKIKATIVNKKGCRYSDTLQVTLSPRGDYSLGKDTTLLVVDTLLLKAPDKSKEYRWMDGSETPTYQVTSVDYKPSIQSYWIAYTDDKGCKWGDTITVQYVDVPDLSDYLHLQLSTYPNPVSDQLTWKLDASQPCRLTIEVADNYGHQLYSEKISFYVPGTEKQIPMSHVAEGTYLVRIKSSTTGKVYGTKAVIKQ